eukprot:13676105-Ditylum_brightwellii.AAC.1
MGPSDMQNSTAEALQALADAITEDRIAVANLLQTNGYLNEQVVNLTKTISTKDLEIEELRKSISELSCTICTLAPNQNNRGGRGGRGGRNSGGCINKVKKEPTPLNIHYCWSHGVTRGPNHTSLNCQHPKEGHKRDATLLNQQGGSLDGIGG